MEGKNGFLGVIAVAVALGGIVYWQQSDSGSAKLEKQIGALNDRIAAMEASLGEIGTDIAGLNEKSGAQAQAIADVAALGSRLAETVGAMGGVMSGGDGGAEEAAAEPEAATGGEDGGTASASAGVGETAVLGDGSVRVFVSRLDTEGGAARVAINGQSMATIAVGESAEAGEGCSVSLDGIADGKATLAYACGS